jgi:hypothetical protein
MERDYHGRIGYLPSRDEGKTYQFLEAATMRRLMLENHKNIVSLPSSRYVHAP